MGPVICFSGVRRLEYALNRNSPQSRDCRSFCQVVSRGESARPHRTDLLPYICFTESGMFDSRDARSNEGRGYQIPFLLLNSSMLRLLSRFAVPSGKESLFAANEPLFFNWYDLKILTGLATHQSCGNFEAVASCWEIRCDGRSPRSEQRVSRRQ